MLDYRGLKAEKKEKNLVSNEYCESKQNYRCFWNLQMRPKLDLKNLHNLVVGT